MRQEEFQVDIGQITIQAPQNLTAGCQFVQTYSAGVLMWEESCAEDPSSNVTQASKIEECHGRSLFGIEKISH